MRIQPTAIQLGAQRWEVRPLTLAQVQAIEPLLLGSAESTLGSVATAVAILRIALARDHAPAAAALDEVEAGAAEIAAAMAQALRLGGFLPKEDVPLGEAGAGATPASIGAGSTPA